MKITSCYQIKRFESEEQLKAFIKDYAFTVVHHTSEPTTDIYVVEDAAHNRSDFVLAFDENLGDHSFRINVEDFDEAVSEMLEKGCVSLFPSYVSETRKVAGFKDPSGNTLLVFEHIK